MLARILHESFMRGKRRKLLSAAAIALGITVATALATMALDVGDKVNHELRSFGANILVTPASDGLRVAVGGVDYRPQGTGAFLNENDLPKLKAIFWRNNIVAFAPYLYVPVAVRGRHTILIGTWFDEKVPTPGSETFQTGLKKLHPLWKDRGQWPDDKGPASCLVGSRIAAELGVKPGDTLVVRLTGNRPATISAGEKLAGKRPAVGDSEMAMPVSGIMETGGVEDDQIVAPLHAVQQLAALPGKVRKIEVSALTKPEDAFARVDVSKLNPKDFDRWFCSPYARSIAYQIQQVIPGAEAKPVYRIAGTEGKILNRLGLLMAVLAAAALVTAALAVSSMMLTTVLERRGEIGLYKSLGATDARVAAIFLLEASIVAVVGGAVGFVAGSLLARDMAVQVFGTPASSHWVILPVALALAILVTLIACVMPLAQGLKASPAAVMRAE